MDLCFLHSEVFIKAVELLPGAGDLFVFKEDFTGLKFFFLCWLTMFFSSENGWWSVHSEATGLKKKKSRGGREPGLNVTSDDSLVLESRRCATLKKGPLDLNMKTAVRTLGNSSNSWSCLVSDPKIRVKLCFILWVCSSFYLGPGSS